MLSPTPAVVADIRHEMGWDVWKFNNELKKLRKMGLVLSVKGGEVRVPLENWPHAKMVAQGYWDRTYGT